MAKEKVKIIKVIKITSVGNRAWVETNVGDMKKPLNAIPAKLLEEYRKNNPETSDK